MALGRSSLNELFLSENEPHGLRGRKREIPGLSGRMDGGIINENVRGCAEGVHLELRDPCLHTGHLCRWTCLVGSGGGAAEIKSV